MPTIVALFRCSSVSQMLAGGLSELAPDGPKLCFAVRGANLWTDNI